MPSRIYFYLFVGAFLLMDWLVEDGKCDSKLLPPLVRKRIREGANDDGHMFNALGQDISILIIIQRHS
jgi:hypothetical protein